MHIMVLNVPVMLMVLLKKRGIMKSSRFTLWGSGRLAISLLALALYLKYFRVDRNSGQSVNKNKNKNKKALISKIRLFYQLLALKASVDKYNIRKHPSIHPFPTTQGRGGAGTCPSYLRSDWTKVFMCISKSVL